jgi:hypothetical protein
VSWSAVQVVTKPAEVVQPELLVEVQLVRWHEEGAPEGEAPEEEGEEERQQIEPQLAQMEVEDRLLVVVVVDQADHEGVASHEVVPAAVERGVQTSARGKVQMTLGRET